MFITMVGHKFLADPQDLTELKSITMQILSSSKLKVNFKLRKAEEHQSDMAKNTTSQNNMSMHLELADTKFHQYGTNTNELIKTTKYLLTNHFIYFLLFYFILSSNLTVIFCNSFPATYFLDVRLLGGMIPLTDLVNITSISALYIFNLST